jgi:hypothetical protein
MHTGIVKFFDRREDKRFGFIQKPNGDEVFFHLNDGRTLVPSTFDPEFYETSPSREPQKGDVLVFEEQPTRKGNRASPWGHIVDFEIARRACCPVHDPADLERYPFLLEVLRRANPHENYGPFTVVDEALTLGTLERKGVHRFRTGEETTNYAVIRSSSGAPLIHALRSESSWPDGIEEGFTPAGTVREQLTEQGINPDLLIALVEVDTGEAKSYLSHFNTQAYLEERQRPRRVRRIATVFSA